MLYTSLAALFKPAERPLPSALTCSPCRELYQACCCLTLERPHLVHCFAPELPQQKRHF